jgi:hypothetical protein
VDVGGGHRVQPLDGGAVLWEHDTPPGYWVARHQVSSQDGEVWTVASPEPLTLHPSLHCDPSTGGCGAHGFVTNGAWRDA